MSNLPDNTGVSPGREEGLPVEAGAGVSPDAAAAELVAHGLLVFLNADSAATVGARVARVMARIEAESRRRLVFPSGRSGAGRRVVRWAIAAGLAIVVTTAILWSGLPVGSAALAEVRRTAAALRTGADRRYEIRVLAWTDDRARGEPNAVYDERATGEMVLRHRPPGYDDYIAVGRDVAGEWAIDSKGAVDRARPKRRWPPWAAVDGESVFAEPLDRLIEQLPRRFALTRVTGMTLEGVAGGVYTRITAVRTNVEGPEPNRVELWIDPATASLERMEFHWNQEARSPERPVGVAGVVGLVGGGVGRDAGTGREAPAVNGTDRRDPRRTTWMDPAGRGDRIVRVSRGRSMVRVGPGAVVAGVGRAMRG